ncbi:MAG: hypothetical protein AAGI92_00610 [Pseudomonadota bacterium]
MRKTATIAVVALYTVATAPTALGQSRAAQWLENEQVKAGCSSGRGKFSRGGIVERDLTGDGRADLIIDHSELTCSGSFTRSGFCGVQACSILFYVREGDLLKLNTETLSIGHEIGPGSRPEIKLAAHGGQSYSMRWFDGSFR